MKKQTKHINISSLLLGLSILIVIFVNWKNIFLAIRLPFLIGGFLLILFFDKIIWFLENYIPKILSKIIIALIPISINLVLWYLFNKYKIKFDIHWYALILLGGFAPLWYNFKSKIIVFISFVLTILWSALFFNLKDFGGLIFKLLVLLCTCGFIFALAETASYKDNFKSLVNTWKSLSLYASSIILLFLTINVFDNFNYFDIGVHIYNYFFDHGLFLFILLFLTISILIFNIIEEYIHKKTASISNYLAFLTVFIPTFGYLFIDNYFVNNPPQYYTISYDKSIWFLFNSFFIFFLLSLIFVAIKNKNIKLLILIIVLSSIFIFTKVSGLFTNLTL